MALDVITTDKIPSWPQEQLTPASPSLRKKRQPAARIRALTLEVPGVATDLLKGLLIALGILLGTGLIILSLPILIAAWAVIVLREIGRKGLSG